MLENLITVEKENYPFPEDLYVPDECRHSIFIPAYGIGCMNYYFLVNFKKRIISCWTVGLEKIKRDLQEKFDLEKISVLPWNKDMDGFFEAIFFAHSAEYYRNKIYISFINGNFILELDVEEDNHRLIYDNSEGGLKKVFSSTNVIYNESIYFTRYGINDIFEHMKNRNKSVMLEIGRYDIVKNNFEILDSFEGPDDIHCTFVSSDGNNIIIIEMSQDPVLRFPADMENITKEEMMEILKNGLCESEVIIYNVGRKEHNVLRIAGGPAHMERDIDEKDIYYMSSHNLCSCNNKVYCFGEAKIDKLRINEKGMQFIGSYTGKDFLRAPSHKLFRFKGKKYMTVPIYPNQIFILDVQCMEVYKKINLSKKKKEIDFSKGPHEYPLVDKTPYSIYPINESKFLYLCNLWNISIYDFEKEEKINSLVYNKDKPLLAMGHASMFNIE